MKPTTPTDILIFELTASARMSARVRHLLSRRLEYISKQTKDHAEQPFTEELISILETLTASVDRAAKFLANPKSGQNDPAIDAAEVLAQLTQGTPKR